MESALSRWESFYVIVGSSAGALTGLQFVVITLIREARTSTSMAEIRAFGSPTVVHFCAVLLVSAIASAPWEIVANAAVAFGACGVAGLAYAISVVRHARRQTGYKPDLEDWIWYIVLPLASYPLLILAAFLLHFHTVIALFLIAAVTLLLLFIGIHNAWDTVTFIAVRGHGEQRESQETRQE